MHLETSSQETTPRRFIDVAGMVDRYKGTIGPAALAKWRCTGRGPGYLKLGGRVLYDLDEVERWERSCERKAG